MTRGVQTLKSGEQRCYAIELRSTEGNFLFRVRDADENPGRVGSLGAYEIELGSERTVDGLVWNRFRRADPE